MAALSALPFTDVGMFDDWSYFRTAEVLARTGHLVYNGWAEPMLGWQVYWGSLFLRCFGDSFTAARMSTLCVSFFSIWLFEQILERSGLERRNAIFGALTLGLSPLYLPLTVVFMTDANALFVLVLCWYLCLRAVQCPENRHAFLWLLAAGVAGAVGGTVRQTAWLPVLCFIPAAAWEMRRRPWAVMTSAISWSVVLLVMLSCIRWWRHEPFAVAENTVEFGIWHWLGKRDALRRTATLLLATFPACAYMLFPVFSAWPTRLRTESLRLRVGVGALSMLLMAWMLWATTQGHPQLLLPWLWDVMGYMNPSTRGMVKGQDDRYLAYFAGFTSLAILISASTFLLLQWRKAVLPDDTASAMAYTRSFIFTGPYLVAYSLVLTTRYVSLHLYDRYFLGVFPMGILFVLLAWQRWAQRRLPLVSYLVLSGMAIFSVAGTHDSFASMRARQAAEDAMVGSGIARNRISNGFEIDGMKQLDAFGYIDQDRIVNPPNAYFPNLYAAEVPQSCKTWLLDKTPAVRPDYVVGLGIYPCLTGQPFEERRYATWLPPFYRVIYVMKLPGHVTAR